jgi:hypothetical protein
MLSEGLASLSALEAFADGWDGEGAPAPSAAAISAARHVLASLAGSGFRPEIDADVMGGVAFTLYGKEGARSVWVACMNGGAQTVVFNAGDGSFPDGCRYGAGAMEKIRTFLASPA